MEREREIGGVGDFNAEAQRRRVRRVRRGDGHVEHVERVEGGGRLTD